MRLMLVAFVIGSAISTVSAGVLNREDDSTLTPLQQNVKARIEGLLKRLEPLANSNSIVVDKARRWCESLLRNIQLVNEETAANIIASIEKFYTAIEAIGKRDVGAYALTTLQKQIKARIEALIKRLQPLANAGSLLADTLLKSARAFLRNVGILTDATAQTVIKALDKIESTIGAIGKRGVEADANALTPLQQQIKTRIEALIKRLKPLASAGSLPAKNLLQQARVFLQMVGILTDAAAQKMIKALDHFESIVGALGKRDVEAETYALTPLQKNIKARIEGLIKRLKPLAGAGSILADSFLKTLKAMLRNIDVLTDATAQKVIKALDTIANAIGGIGKRSVETGSYALTPLQQQIKARIEGLINRLKPLASAGSVVAEGLLRSANTFLRYVGNFTDAHVHSVMKALDKIEGAIGAIGKRAVDAETYALTPLQKQIKTRIEGLIKRLEPLASAGSIVADSLLKAARTLLRNIQIVTDKTAQAVIKALDYIENTIGTIGRRDVDAVSRGAHPADVALKALMQKHVTQLQNLVAIGRREFQPFLDRAKRLLTDLSRGKAGTREKVAAFLDELGDYILGTA